MVRITAAKSLKVVIDDFEFCSEEFEPFLGTSFGQLFQLLKEVKECDTKVSEQTQSLSLDCQLRFQVPTRHSLVAVTS